jgi:putative membrane protein
VQTTANADVMSKFSRNRTLQAMILFYAGFWLWAAVAPIDRFDWFLENLLVFAAVLGLGLAYREHPLSNLSYLLIVVFLALHTLGAHYTYSEVPLGAWFGETLDFGRNHYDRVVHLSFGLLISYPLWDVFFHHSNIRGFPLYFLPFAIVAAASNIYEFLEWCIATIVAPDAAMAFLGTQGDVFDAQKDTGLAIIGSIISLTAIALIGRRVSSGAGP